MKAPGQFIVLNRSLLAWEWYGDIPVRILFVHILLKANWKPGKFQGEDIHPGSFPTSTDALAKETGLSQQQTKTALSKLRSTGEITSRATSKFTVVTVANWTKFQNYQPDKQPRINRAATNDQPENNLESTTIEQGNNTTREQENNSPIGEAADRRDPAVQEVVEFFQEMLGGRLDGTVKKNRWDANTLLKRMAADFPGFEPIVSVKQLIIAGREDPFHKKNATSFRYLMEHATAIIEARKARATDPKTQSDGDRKVQLAAELAKRSGQAA